MPDSIGRYQIGGELGHGAMGVVYRATDPTIGRTVALKTIRTELASPTESVSLGHLAERFRNEARAAGSLNHRNIVTIYDAGEDQGTFFIAMEYLEGATLQQILAQRRSLPPDEIVRIATQICAGLDFAHSRGIVHRDIKPANIIITADGTVKITDFGIAKAEASLAASQGITLTGQIVGTPDYMSPEQVKGNSVDGRSDLFSLGVMLYQMATGEKPFPGESITTVIYKIVHETPVPPHSLDASIPPGLSAVITRALSKSPDARFPSARAMGEALRNYRESHSGETATLEVPVARQQPTAVPGKDNGASSQTAIAQSGTREKPRGMRTLAWSVIALLIVAGSILLFTSRKRQQQPTAVTPPATSTSAGQTPAPTPPAAPPSGDLSQQIGKLGEEITKTTGAAISEATNATVSSMSGTLHIVSTPHGATVSVDGNSNGWKTPVNIPSISVGTHTIKLAKPGYKTLSVHASVIPGNGASVKAILAPESSQSESSAEVFPAAGSEKLPARKSSSEEPTSSQSAGTPTTATGVVIITSNPTGAKIVLEQFANGQVTPTRLTLPAGTHELVLIKEGYLPVTRNITVKANRVTEVKADLPRVPGVP